MKEIKITEIEDLYIGQVENTWAGTGCTVVVAPNGACAGLDVRGGGPASRESELLKPMAACQSIHAIVLSGGSAFGLGVANGVMKCLEERNIGYDVGVTKVPLVVQSDLFDLTVADPFTRPDAQMGYEACECALNGGNYQDGNLGAGCGATVGKCCGMEFCMKTGIGSYAIEQNGLKIGAIVALNALGDVFDVHTGEKIAGLLSPSKDAFRSTEEVMAENVQVVENKFVGNTTIGIIMTNATFDKSRLCKIAGMAHDGYARSIRPVHTSADGDSIYAIATGKVEADQDVVGMLAANVMSEAIIRAVKNASTAYGYPSYNECSFIKK